MNKKYQKMKKSRQNLQEHQKKEEDLQKQRWFKRYASKTNQNLKDKLLPHNCQFQLIHDFQ